VLTARDITFGYPRRPVLKGVSAEFPRGVVTALIGPNGAGKSTLLRLLLGVLRPSRGEVTKDGRGVRSIAAAERARVMAYVPQQSQVAFPFTAAEVVRLGRYAMGGGTDAFVQDSLARVGISERANDLYGHLSAGQQQRVTLARALAQLRGHGGGAFLLADEPVSAMDPNHALHAMEVLRDLAGQGCGVVVVLHDLSLVLRYAQRVVVLDGSGQVAGAGATQEVLTAELLGSVFSVPFRPLVDPGAPGSPAAWVPVQPL
jgi:iron complex transport system ATP-binding protein